MREKRERGNKKPNDKEVRVGEEEMVRERGEREGKK